MGLFNLFKKKTEEVIEFEKVSWNSFDKWFSNKKKEVENVEEEFFVKAKERINDFVLEINEQISILERVDISDRKVQDRVKYIVRENLVNYILYLQKLVDKLKSIDGGKNFVKKFNSIFTEFEEKSNVNFNKANFLVRKETDDTKDILRRFLKDIEKIMKDNLKISEINILKFIDNEMSGVEHIENAKLEILKAIREDDIKVSNLNENIKFKEKEIINLKNSKKFLDNEKKKKEIEKKEKILENQIEKLKEQIDFKSLTGFYHTFEKEMALVKECKENFKQIFKRSRENKFLTLIDGAKLLTNEIFNKIKKIDELKKEIESISVEGMGSEDIENEIEKMKSEIDYVESNKEVKEKKLKQLNFELEEIKEKIRNKLKEMNIELE